MEWGGEDKVAAGASGGVDVGITSKTAVVSDWANEALVVQGLYFRWYFG